VIALLHAIWQGDGAFPSGSFAFSNGLEALGEAPLDSVLRDALLLRWGSAERVVLAQAHRAGGDVAAIAAADAALEAATPPAPLRDGSRRNGAAFLLAHARIGTPSAEMLRAACRVGVCLGHLAAMQGAVFRALGLDLAASIASAGYAMLAALVSASVRLGRVGVIEGQRALAAALPTLANLAATPPPPEAQVGGFVPLLDIAACRHARSGMRLFAT